MAKIFFDTTERRFSIQGETGFQLRRLKAWLETIDDPDSFKGYPNLPTFYKNIEDPMVKMRVRYQLNQQLSLGDKDITGYIPAIKFTREYDKEHGTKILDYGFVIIMHGESSGMFVGAAISLKDRKGRDVYTFFVPRGEVLTHKKMRLSKTRVFAAMSPNDEEPKMFVEDIKNDYTLDWKLCHDAPEPVRNKILFGAKLPNTDGEFDYISDYLERKGEPVCDEGDSKIYKVGNYYLRINSLDGGMTVYGSEKDQYHKDKVRP